MRRAPEEPADDVPATRIRQRLSRDARVRRHADYRVIQARGRRVHSSHYVWIVMPRSQPALGGGQAPALPSQGDARPSQRDARAPSEARLGITITKKTAPNAVARNRVKRVLREVFRTERALFPAGCDVVVVGKAGAEKLGHAEALAELRDVAAKLASAGSGAPRRGNEGERRNA